jgi:exodeoxyribonuclease-3
MSVTKTIKIFSWNVNGLRAAAKKESLSWIDDFQPDILCLQEIKVTQEKLPKSFNKEFKNFVLNSGMNKGLSGTLSYSDITFNKVSFCEIIDSTKEGRIIEQHYENIVVFNVYFPNGKVSEERLKYKINFFNKFYKYCENLRKSGKSIIICGDFNTAHKDIDLKKTKIYSKAGFTDKERKGLNNFLDKNYIDTYRYIHGEKEEAYTWWSYRSNGKLKNEGWRIDYIFVSSDLKDKIKNAYILEEISGSDHCPIGVEIEF